MTSAPARPPFQPNLKARSTAQSSQLLAIAGETPTASRDPSRNRRGRPQRQDLGNDDFTSKTATVSLIRRRLLITDGSHGLESALPAPIEELLPPLTSSNDVDLQLYAIISIVIKDFVNTWYSKITPDRTFVDEVIQIIAHCSRALEQRLRQIDAVELCFDEIFALVERHIFAYRAAKASSAAFPYGRQPRQIYHSLNPHPALAPDASPEQQAHAETVYRQLLVQGALAALLPTEDLQNACLRTLLGDIIGDLILGRALGERVCESWFLHDAVSKIVAIIAARTTSKVTDDKIQADARGRLEKFGLLSAKSNGKANYSPKPRQSSLSALAWTVLQYGYLTFLAMRFILLGIMHARHLPSRSRHSKSFTPSPNSVHGPPQVTLPTSYGSDQSSHLVLAYRIFPVISTLLDLSTRMPWLASTFNFWQHYLTSGSIGLGGLDSKLDKFLHHALEQYVLPTTLLPVLLLNLRTIIFPGNTMGPAALPPPSPKEALQIRRHAALDVLSLIPSILAETFFATKDLDEMAQQVEEDILDVFSDTNMNKHLMYGILELVMVRLVPELAEKTPSELLSERGVSIDYGEKEIL